MEMKMTSEEFRALLEKLDGNSLKTLIEKNATYSENHNGDCLHNFRAGAEIMGGTPAQAAWGYMTKHLVALRDMIDRDDFSDLDNLLEKCQDINNYIRFIWCIGNERNKLSAQKGNASVRSYPTKILWPGNKSVVFNTEKDAIAVLDATKQVLANYGFVTVADFYDLADVPANDVRYSKVGWRTLKDTKIKSDYAHEYYIDFPTPTPCS